MSYENDSATGDAPTSNDTANIVLSDGSHLKWNHNLAALEGMINIFFEHLEADYADLFGLWTTNAYSFKGKTYTETIETIDFLMDTVKDIEPGA